MSKLVKIAEFDNVFDIRFNLLKDMLDEAEIGYVTNNENSRSVKPTLSMVASSIAIDVLVCKENLEEALKILNSIE